MEPLSPDELILSAEEFSTYPAEQYAPITRVVCADGSTFVVPGPGAVLVLAWVLFNKGYVLRLARGSLPTVPLSEPCDSIYLPFPSQCDPVTSYADLASLTIRKLRGIPEEGRGYFTAYVLEDTPEMKLLWRRQL